jgi:hypothetical protein
MTIKNGSNLALINRLNRAEYFGGTSGPDSINQEIKDLS